MLSILSMLSIYLESLILDLIRCRLFYFVYLSLSSYCALIVLLTLVRLLLKLISLSFIGDILAFITTHSNTVMSQKMVSVMGSVMVSVMGSIMTSNILSIMVLLIVLLMVLLMVLIMVLLMVLIMALLMVLIMVLSR